eukprot:TRINITY_DN71269_c0_g1_i1.p1 TRINITY_DN71269_c0_g1~~TRINITY_DN71269_c0_g1_i1.p1  ORF type:complete len:572 (-),score=118.43 TRINITY_DN71269_c0_g1_i1:54-1769(-)
MSHRAGRGRRHHGALALLLGCSAPLARPWRLLERNCWPEFDVHYGLCCHEELPPDPRCFDLDRTYERCCTCPSSNDEEDAAAAAAASPPLSPLGLRLTRHFFGPLLCDGPSVRSRREDFLIQDFDGSERLMRVYIYPLHRRFNAELLNRLQVGGWSSGSECDYGLTPCTEERWNGLFSVNRQFATEVLTLLKFLAAPPGVLTSDPDSADLFVVPYFAKTDCAESGNFGKDPCWGKCKCATAVKHLFQELHHYNWNSRGRHLFLATGDFKDLPVEIQGQPMVLSLGASLCDGHVVVPSPALDPVLQPDGAFAVRESTGRTPERHIFAFWFGSNDKTWRQEVVRQLLDYAKTPRARTVVVHDITGDYVTRDIWRTDAGSPQLVLEEMFRSVFCPVVQGDVPHQKRLFDSMLTGCIPVVVAFPSHVPGKVSWWLPGGPPVERMVPFPRDIDYRSFVVEVPQAVVEAGGLVEALLRIPEAELEARRAALRRARSLVRYDFAGSSPDAFTATMRELRRFLERQRAAPRLAAGGASGEGLVGGPVFDCGAPPLREADGNLMYGHMACCLVDAFADAD